MGTVLLTRSVKTASRQLKYYEDGEAIHICFTFRRSNNNVFMKIMFQTNATEQYYYISNLQLNLC